MGARIDEISPDVFKDGPADYLVKQIALLIGNEPHFKKVFGEQVADYDREDFPIRGLPALRVYCFDYEKTSEMSGYIEGTIQMDVILPPSLRRADTEKFSSIIANAMMQQFRRLPFFSAMRGVVPGLNELGKHFSVDKRLVYQNTEQADECPVVHMTANFRIDLKEWDEYLESQGRTREDPFDKTLENLREITAVIQGIRVDADLTTKDVSISTDQKV